MGPIESLIYDDIVSSKEKIAVNAGACRYNYRCSYNAVHEAIESDDSQIAMVMYMDGRPIIHFINYKDGQYTDNTLGHWSSQFDYYLIKMIDQEEFFNVNNIFESYRQSLINKLPFILRLRAKLRLFFNNKDVA